MQANLQIDRDIAIKAQEVLRVSDLESLPSTIAAGRDLLLQGNNTVDISALQNVGSGFWSGQKTLGNMVFRSDNPIIGEPRVYAYGNFSLEKLDGTSLGLFSPYSVINGGVILAMGNVSLGNYKGGSLSILAGGSVTLGNVEILRTATVDKSISPNNQNLFNATKRYADLASFNLTDYQLIKNSDGSVKEVVPVPTPIAIDGSTKPTLDVRAGVDWAQLGGLPTSPIIAGTVKPDPVYTNPATRADITVNGNIRISQPEGLVLLTNQFVPNSLNGTITTQGINTSTNVREANGGAIRAYSRGNIELNNVIWNSSASLDLFEGYVADPSAPRNDSGNGGAISLVSSSGNITLNNSRLSSFSDSFTFLANSRNGGAIALAANAGRVTLNDSTLESYTSSTRIRDNGDGSISIDLSNPSQTGNAGAIALISNLADLAITNTTLKSTTRVISGNAGIGGEISLASNFGNVVIENSTLNSSSQVEFGVSSNGGAISLASKSGNITIDNTTLSSQSYLFEGESGNGGKVSLASESGHILLHDSQLISYSNAPIIAGDGGVISLTTNLGDIGLDNVTLSSYSVSRRGGTSGSGATIFLGANSGDIILNNTQLNSYSYSSLLASGTKTGNAGDIFIYAPNGSIISPIVSSLRAFAVANTSDLSSGSGGNVTLIAKNQISNLDIFTQSSASQAGQVKLIGLGDLSINNLQISTSKSVQIPDPDFPSGFIDLDTGTIGKSGNVEVSSIGSLTIAKTLINSNTQSIEPAGNISFTSPTAIAFQNSEILSNTSSKGNAGNILINAGQGIAISNNSKIAATTNGQVENAGQAGDITLNTQSVNITGGSQVLAETNSSGTGGNITINAPNFINLTREQDAFPVLSVQSTNSGKAGNILINTNTLNLSDQARITATATATATNPEGGGSITLNASTMNLFGTVGVFAETQGNSPAGTLLLNTYNNQPNLKLTLAPNSQISASTSGTGNGGSIFLAASESINISGQGKLAVETSSIGNAGNISFTTKQLTLTDGILISASTSGSGKAGDVSVKANNFNLSNGARIQTTTSGVGDSGSVNIIVDDNFSLTGNNTGLFANTEANSTGRGGNIFIDPQLVLLQDGATITASSLGSGIGGDVTILAKNLSLLNNSSIKAETASTNGGNINLNIADLLLFRFGSQISTTAGTNQSGGNGGNININAGFIVGAKNENSNIFANAFTGNGGNINIATNGIYGLSFSSQPTDFSDITASSQFGLQGNVVVTTPNVDPSRGLTTLPVNLADPSKQVSQGCAVGSKLSARDNSFTVSGRGGLPKSPSDELSSSRSLVELAELVPSNTNQISVTEPNREVAREIRKPIVEANAIARNSEGKLRLVATSTPHSPAIPQLACPQ